MNLHICSSRIRRLLTHYAYVTFCYDIPSCMLHMCACERGFMSVSLSSHLLSHLQLPQADTEAGNCDTVKHCMFAY